MGSENDKKDAASLPPSAREIEVSLIDADPFEHDPDDGWDAPLRPVPPPVPSKRPGKTLIGAAPMASPPPPPVTPQPPMVPTASGKGTTKIVTPDTPPSVNASTQPGGSMQPAAYAFPLSGSAAARGVTQRPLTAIPAPIELSQEMPPQAPSPISSSQTRVTTPPLSSERGAPRAARSLSVIDQSQLRAELARRAERLIASDPVGAARALIELGVFELRTASDENAAKRALEQARARQPQMPAALERLRRLTTTGLDEALALIDEELKAAGSDALRADLWAARGRVCAAKGRLAEAREAFSQALRREPRHASALIGLEVALLEGAGPRADRALIEALDAHLARLAAVYAGAEGGAFDDRLTAWLHVERAQLLDGRLGDAAQAHAALRRAVELSSGPGPERHALYRFLVSHRDDAGLCEALLDEAEHEPDSDRASRLIYAAARIRAERLGQWQDAISLLQKALMRVPMTSPTARRALAELGKLQERAGEREAAIDAWRKHLTLLSDASSIGSEHARIAKLLEAVGRDDEAVVHARASLVAQPSDEATREFLDRILERLGRHEDRVALWLEVSNAGASSVPARVSALSRAAQISDRKLGRPREAVEHLRAAWALSPGEAGLFEALSALLAAPSREPGDDVRNVKTRVELYAEAAHAARDAERRVPLLEKLLLLWEDELSQPKRAMEIAEQILMLEPRHRGAILALGRNAARAGEPATHARALKLEASITQSLPLRRSLLLRAAELLRDTVGDAEAALQLVNAASELDASDPLVLRARATHLARMGRHDEAKAALLGLVAKASGDEAFALWTEIASLDEHGRRSPIDAVEAYRKAAKARPGHMLPQREVTRLLGQLGEHRKLVEALKDLASGVQGQERAFLLRQSAEVLELALRDDKAAHDALLAAETTLGGLAHDLSLAESMERILLRTDDRTALASLYRRWLDASSEPCEIERLRLALSQVVFEAQPVEAATVIERALADNSQCVPALRLARQLHRQRGNKAQLAAILMQTADVVRSGLARRGALWDLTSLEAQIGPSPALDALERIASETLSDSGALDEAIRLATKLVADTSPPDRPSPRSRLLSALRLRKELAGTPSDKALYEVEEASVHERDPDGEVGSTLAALAAYRVALSLSGQSLLAARGLERLATELGDRESRVLAHLALWQLVERPVEQAANLVSAADLLGQDASQASRQLELYEQALALDADCTAAARALSMMLAREPGRLAVRLGEALDRAKDPAQIALLGIETGRAVLALCTAGEEGPEPTAGLRAVSRVLAQSPDDFAALMLLARLQSVARLWPEARETLLRVAQGASAPEARVQALFELAALYRGPLADAGQAQTTLEAVLAIDPRSRRALEMLHQVGSSRGDRPLVISSLRRLADVAPDASSRVELLLRLAEAHREAGEYEQRLRTLCDAVLTKPDDERAMSTITRSFRQDTPDGVSGYSQALTMLLQMAKERGVTPDPRWLSTLGLLEATVLMRPSEALEHLTAATKLPAATAQTRVALGRGLEALGHNADAARVLRDVLAGEPNALANLDDPNVALASLEAALAKDGRAEERLAVQEARACIGEMPPEWLTALRNRQLGPAPFAGTMTVAELPRLLLPDARHACIEVFSAIAPVVAKMLRFEFSSLGLSSRERIGSRDGHPTRLLAEKLARAFGIESFELYLSSSWPGMMRAFPGDPPVLVGPEAFAALPELEQTAALAQLFAGLALGVPWLDDLRPDAIDGLFLASLRTADPAYGSGHLSPAREQAAQSLLPAVQKAIGRRQRKQLEQIVDRVDPALDAGRWAPAIRASEHRIAYLSCGSTVSAIDYLRRIDRELRATDSPRALFQHPITSDVLRYSLTAEAYAERRRLGTVWK